MSTEQQDRGREPESRLIVLRNPNTGDLHGLVAVRPEELTDFRGSDGSPREVVATVSLSQAASAPALLEALRNLVNSPGINQDDLRETEEAIEAAREALALAEKGA